MTRRRALFAFLVLGFVVLGAAALAGYWFWWAARLEAGIAAWTEDQRQIGYRISYDGPVIDGFPLDHVARFEAPVIAAPSGRTWRGPALRGEAPIWDPWTIALSFPGHHRLEHLGFEALERLDLDSAEAGARVRIGRGGRLDAVEAELRDVALAAAPIGRLRADALRLRLAPRYPEGAGAATAFAFTGETWALELPAALATPLDPRAEHLEVEGRLDGAIPDAEPRVALALWREAGGVVVIDRLRVDWPPLTLEASGRLTLDAALRPYGELAARVAGLPEVMERLADEGAIAPEDASATTLAVLAFADGRDLDGRPEVELPLILRQGFLYLGPVRLARLRPVL